MANDAEKEAEELRNLRQRFTDGEKLSADQKERLRVLNQKEIDARAVGSIFNPDRERPQPADVMSFGDGELVGDEELGRREFLAGLGHGLGVALPALAVGAAMGSVVGANAFAPSETDQRTLEIVRSFVLSYYKKMALIAIVENKPSPQDTLPELGHLLKDIKSARLPQSAQPQSQDIWDAYEKKDMLWLKPVLEWAVKLGNKAAIMQIVSNYPGFTDELPMPNVPPQTTSYSYNVLRDIETNFPGGRAEKTELLRKVGDLSHTLAR